MRETDANDTLKSANRVETVKNYDVYIIMSQ